MENENNIEVSEVTNEDKVILGVRIKKEYLLPASILTSSILLSGTWLYTTTLSKNAQAEKINSTVSDLENKVIPSEGVIMPVVWGDMGAKLVKNGVIDAEQFRTIYEARGAFSEEYRKLLLGTENGKLKITSENSGYLLNLLWAFGLANKNEILEKGEMVDPAYGGAGSFASTGGWTISKGKPIDHYSRHELVKLTLEQQQLVDKISRGIYRPCCGNSTHFPDCNHGMAMLGLLELMASQNVSEQDMWKTALTVNSYWFPNNYLTLATYMEQKGVDWKDVSPREMLSAKYSSSRGNAKISAEVVPVQSGQGGSGCGIDAGGQVAQPRQQAGCGI